MLARHPLTGKPIRILNCEATLWKDAATLVWLDGTVDLTKPWSRYTVGVSTVEDYHAVDAAGIQPEICILLGDPAAAAAWLRAELWRRVAIAVAPRAVLQAVGMDSLRHVQNMLCLEEVHHLYPHLGGATSGEEADARVLVAGILRYCRTGPVPPTKRPLSALTCLPVVPPPAPLIFLTQYYRPDKAARRKEIDTCLAKNIANPLIDRIVLLNESDDVPLPTQSPKVTAKSIGRRLNFADVVRWIYEEAPAGSIVIFANSDIYLDETWRNLWTFNMNDTFLSLLRWDDGPVGSPPTLFGPRADSQDTWAVAADSVKARTWNWASLDIPFGKGGCDNAINVEMLRQKFVVANPALTLVTHHVHQSGYRTYNPQDIVDRPMYMHIQPTGLHDLKPEKTMPEIVAKVSEPAHVLEPTGAMTESQRRTFQTMATKAHKGVVAEGRYTPALDVPIYGVTDAFVNHTGLVGTYTSILIGNTAAAKEAWGKVELSKVTPAAPVGHALVAPAPDAVFKDAPTFLLRYLGKILSMRMGLDHSGEFLAVDRPDIVAALGLFRWNEKTVPVLRRDPNAAVFAKAATVWHPQDGAAAWVTSSEVDALRRCLRAGWEPNPSKRGEIVCFVDGVWVTDALVKMLEREFPDEAVNVITPTTPIVDAVETLLGARAFVYKCCEPAWGLLWALPRGATAIELQFEMTPTLESIHMAQVCGVEHHMCIKARDVKPNPADAADFAKKVVAALGGSAAASPTPTPRVATSATPILYIPSPDTKGFFAHAGDSFREMARIWERRGYVRIVYQEGLANIWLDAVGAGGTLLYDRPTMEWLNRSNPVEREWTAALFGNPDPRGAVGGAAWTFWPRRPELVEDLVASGRADATMAGRSRRIVFYGRSENAVQAERRAADWGAVFGPFDEFIHLKGMAPYPLTQREYLEHLADARFGLCLAGYGRKCHREIECMAMGCVPVVAPEVDMECYAVPPVEGVHYLRCGKPEDLDALLSGVDAAKWTKMSVAAHAWWRANASAEGSWALTRRLAGL
jgi:hypothetical protein